MDWLREIFHRLTDVETLVRVGGLTAMTAVIFAGDRADDRFLPAGDSLLVTAGSSPRRGSLDIWT
jgi:hypothetical protein